MQGHLGLHVFNTFLQFNKLVCVMPSLPSNDIAYRKHVNRIGPSTEPCGTLHLHEQIGVY